MTKNLLADEEEVDMPSDEEADFNDHIEKLVRDGKAPPPRNGKNKGLPASEKTKTTKTTTTTITSTTTTSTTTNKTYDDNNDNANDNSEKEDEEKEKNKPKKQKSLQLQIESDTAEKPQEIMSARSPATSKKNKQKPQRRSSRS